jgi:hypothetical protein
MIDRTRRSLPLTTIAAVALALCALLAVAARPAHALVPGDNFPCSVRRDLHECQAECAAGTFLKDCFCIWDSRNAPSSGTCPPGDVCCWSLPCEKCDQVNDGNQFTCEQFGAPNCSWNADSGECRCTPPLVNAGYDGGDLVSPTPGKTYRAPLDCVCPFTTVAEWLATGVCNPPVPANKDACKKNGWRTLTRANGSTFTDQGTCIEVREDRQVARAHYDSCLRLTLTTKLPP